MDDTTVGGVLATILCRVFVPGCFYDVDQWVLAMGVPISTAIVGGMIFPRWWNAFLVGAFCFVLHIAGRTVFYYLQGYYLQSGDVYLAYSDSPLGVFASAATIIIALMAAVAFGAHAAKRLVMWALARG